MAEQLCEVLTFRVADLATANFSIQQQQVSPRLVQAREFLRAHPASAYTTAVTLENRTLLPMLELHAARLAQGAKDILDLSLTDAEQVTRIGFSAGIWALSRAHRNLQEDGSNEHVESRIVLVLSKLSHPCSNLGLDSRFSTETGDEKTVLLHVLSSPWKVSPKMKSPVRVEVRGQPRPNPSVKHTQWVHQRRPYEEARAENIYETILMDADPQGSSLPVLLEGLVSNLFVFMQDGSLWTSNASILKGTIRQAILHCARQRNIPVIESAPQLVRRADFDSAFICNATNLIIPIHNISFPTLSNCAALQLSSSARTYDTIGYLYKDVLRHLVETAATLPTVD